MADIQIVADGEFTSNNDASFRGMVWVNLTLGYFFYTDADDPDNFNYVKTADSGQTWDAPVIIDTAVSGNTIIGFDTQYERDTPGDTGDLIHIVYMSPTSTFDITHKSLNVTNDVLSAGHNINNDGLSLTFGNFPVSITKSRGGNLYANWRLGGVTPNTGSARSTDGGGTWVGIADANDGFDQVMFFPGNEADDQDIWAVYWDISANELSLKTFDDSDNSWSETSISGSMVDSSLVPQMNGAIRHSDNHLILVAHSDKSAAHDLLVWDINGAGSITAKTNLFTGQADQFSVALTLDQNTDDIYVAYYIPIVAVSEMRCVYKISTDGGITWGNEIRYGETDREYRGLWAMVSVARSSDGRWQPALFDLTSPTNDAYTNFNDSVELLAGTTQLRLAGDGVLRLAGDGVLQLTIG